MLFQSYQLNKILGTCSLGKLTPNPEETIYGVRLGVTGTAECHGKKQKDNPELLLCFCKPYDYVY